MISAMSSRTHARIHGRQPGARPVIDKCAARRSLQRDPIRPFIASSAIVRGLSISEHVRRALDLADAAEPKLPLAPDHEKAGRRRRWRRRRRHRSSAPRRTSRSRRRRPRSSRCSRAARPARPARSDSSRQQHVGEPAEHAGPISAASCGPFGQTQPNGSVARPAIAQIQREIEHDRRGGLGVGEPPGLDHRAGVGEGGEQSAQRPRWWRRRCRAAGASARGRNRATASR